MSKPIDSTRRVNTYIDATPQGDYVVSRGGEKQVYKDRYSAANNDQDVARAWDSLKGGMLAWRKGQIGQHESRQLTPSTKVHSGEFVDRNGQTNKLAIFTESLGTPPFSGIEAVRAVQISLQGDTVHFHSTNPRETTLAADLLQVGAKVFTTA